MLKFCWKMTLKTLIILFLISASQAQAWQKQVSFPDWKGYTDDTLAMNSITGFKFWHGQGKINVKISDRVKAFSMFINSKKINTQSLKPGGNYEVDISDYTIDGINSLQVSNIEPHNLKDAVKISIPYPVVLDGNLEDSGLRSEALDLISRIISSDISHGFSSAQLAIIRNGRLVYSKSWGKVNTADSQAQNATRNTLYDLASVSKMLTVNFAVQKLASDGLLDIDSRVLDVLKISTRDKSKSSITIRDLLCHRAGFPAEVHYHDPNYDIASSRHNENIINAFALYTGIYGSEETRRKTLNAILRTPLKYKPGTKILYSDIDYMLLCFIIEKITNMRLDEYLAKNFWLPMNLTHITFNPLKNGFSREDCAATEIDGNTTTRGNYVKFAGLRNYTIQGEVHDEKAFHSMAGISGHAGLFANAEDAAKSASVMLTGGWGEHKFFSQNIIDLFTAPQDKNSAQWGLGWWREGEDQRAFYFGTNSPSFAFGHQGFTGTLIMVDPSRNLALAYLTNKINTPALKPLRRRKTFAGNWYTASTLGFVPQILMIGIDSNEDISEQLASLMLDMAEDSKKLIPEGSNNSHPAVRNSNSKLDLINY